MTGKELAVAIIKSHKEAPQDFETFKQEVTDAYEKFMKTRRQLGDELIESEDKMCETLGHILDIEVETGLLESIDNIIFTKVLKAISTVTGFYKRIKG